MWSAKVTWRSILVTDLELIFTPMKVLECKICAPSLAGLHVKEVAEFPQV